MANPTVKADGGGRRYNDGKNALSLLPTEWVEGLGVVMTRGAIKYDRRNWERGMSWSTMLDCAKRHILAFEKMENGGYDVGESGCHHLAQAAWNILALMSYHLRGIGTDDIPRYDLKNPVAMPPGPVLQAIIDKKKAAEAAPKPKPTIAELEAILREEPATTSPVAPVYPESERCDSDCPCRNGTTPAPPVDDAFVAVGAERFSDHKIQTVKSLAEATAEFHKGHGDGDDTSGPFDSDCTCRSTLLEKACAEHGCGFCAAAKHMAGRSG